MNTPETKKVAKRAAQFGFVLGLICHFMPPEYRPICDLIAQLCTGGIL